MPRFFIEHIIAQAGDLTAVELRAISEQSNEVLRNLGPDIQWERSFITDDKIYTMYIARDEELVREHARQCGFPVDHLMIIRGIIDPTTAE